MKRFLNFRLLFAAIALLLPFAAIGAEKTLVIELDNGEIYKINLLDEPVITMSGDRFIVDSKSLYLGTYREAVVKFYFINDVTSIESTQKNVITYTQTEDNRILITNLPEKDHIVVCDLDGHLYNSSVSRNEGEITIDLNGCPKGVYIIKIGNKQTIKIGKK